MRLRAFSAVILLRALCFAALQLLAFAHAAAPGRDAGPAAAAAPILTAVEQYVEAFRAAYQPATHDRQALNAAEAAFAAAGQELLPRLTFAESLEWDAYAALALELEAGIELPLLSPTTEPQLELAEFDLEMRRLALRSAGEDAFATLLIDLANLATVTWAEALVRDALDRFDTLEFDWHAATAHRSLGYVQPRDRDTFDSYQRLAQAEAWLSEQSQIMLGRLARSLEVPKERIQAPAMDDLERWLATGRTEVPDLASCQGSSLMVEAATLRHVRNLANDALEALPGYSFALTANVDYEFNPWSTGTVPPGNQGGTQVAGLNAAIALEGRYLVPDGWPFGGNIHLAFGLDGASQRLNLAWPPLPLPLTVEVDRDKELSLELASIAVELAALRNAAAQATADRALSERQLTWAIIDAAPMLADDEVRQVMADAVALPSLGLLERITGDVMVDLQLTELRIEHAFGRVAELSARVQYLGACSQL